MVILPYRDRLMLFSKYLQQLVMESLGKEKDVNGKIVNQGIAVYGNKGTTDQHAYVQQLRDGVNNFFATFIEVLHDQRTTVPRGRARGHERRLSERLPSGHAGTPCSRRTANRSRSRSRSSMPSPIGALIALYERAVGFYASLVNINAYHQPGVEAGKKMAGEIIKLQLAVITYLTTNSGKTFTAEEIAAALMAEKSTEASVQGAGTCSGQSRTMA